MRRNRECADYLKDILENAAQARQFVAGVEFDAFRANDEKVLAVTCGLEIIVPTGDGNLTVVGGPERSRQR